MKRKIIILSIIIGIVVPSLMYAAPPGVYGGSQVSLTGLADDLVDFTKTILWSIAVAFVIVMFVLAGFKYLTAQGDISKVSEATRFVIFGVVGTALIILAWSIVAVVRHQLSV